MGLIKTINAYFSKSDYDFDRPDVTLYNFHPQFRLFLAGNGFFSANQNSKHRLILPCFNIGVSLVGIALLLMYIHHGLAIGNNEMVIESVLYVVILLLSVLVIACVLAYKTTFAQLLVDLNEDFVQICQLGSPHKSRFLEGQLLIWKMCVTWIGFTYVISVTHVMNTMILLIYQSLFSTITEDTVRPLIFITWLPHDDPQRTPNYEVFTLWHISLAFVVPQSLGVFIYFLFHILYHYNTIMDLIILDFENLFDGLDESVISLPRDDQRRLDLELVLKKRISRIVKWHVSVFRSMKFISKVYKVPLICQLMFSSIEICTVSYQVAEDLDNGKFNYFFFMLGMALCVQLFIPCYLGTISRAKGLAVGDACFNCHWESTPLTRLIYKDILIIIQRAQEPLGIKFAALPNLDLETFTSIITTAYSYFNMLRHYR